MSFQSRSRSRGRADRTGAADPSVFFGTGDSAGPDRKTFQLCKQVARTLSLALGECGDELLREALVDAVDPAPDASRLLVTFFPSTPSVDADLLLQHLNTSKPRLRSFVAEAICRKRAPELTFCVGWPFAEAP